jgi:hypothetical protein
MELFSADPFSTAQLWGYLRYPLVIAMYASRREFVMRICGGLVNAASAIHYGLLGIPTAALAAVVSGSRIVMPALPEATPQHERRLWAGAYLLTFLALAWVSYHGWLSIFAAMLTWASTASFLLLRGRPLRERLFQLEFVWLVFGVASQSYSQIMISLTVIPIMFLRLQVMRRPAA